MRDLFLSELRRFRKAALLAAALHLVLLFLLCRFWDMMQIRWQGQVLVLAFYLACSLGFGLYQFGTYRQPNRWLWLMHRPLPRWQLVAAICGASAALIAFVIALPGWLTLAGIRLFSTRVVDLHHYAVFGFAVLFAWSAWLCAAYMMLNRSLLGAAVLALPFMLMFHLTTVYALLAAGAVSVLLLSAMVYFAMKPNRMEPPRSPGAVLATALPLQLAFYFVLLWAGSLAYQYGGIVAGTHPLNSDMPPRGGSVEVVRAKPAARMAMGLAASADPRAAHWLLQLPLLQTEQKIIMFDAYPLHAEIAPTSATSFEDNANGMQWTFSHDQRAFAGRKLYTGEPVALVPSHELPIVPQTSGDADGRYAVSRHQIATFNTRAPAWETMMRLRNDEVLLAPATPLPPNDPMQRQFVLTTKRLVVFRREAADRGEVRELYGVPLPVAAAELQRVDVTRLLDGALVSFVSGRHMIDGLPEGEQLIMYVDMVGKASVIARRALKHDFPLLFEHKEWWLSPVLHAASALPDLLLGSGSVLPFNPLPVARPPMAWAAALTAALLSGLASWLWLRRSNASPARRNCWIAACVLLGPPSFFCLMVVQPRAAAPLRASPPAPSPATAPA